ncbi:MAG: DUF2510 domain-containing protein [Acidimicrobiales bacterium]
MATCRTHFTYHSDCRGCNAVLQAEAIGAELRQDRHRAAAEAREEQKKAESSARREAARASQGGGLLFSEKLVVGIVGVVVLLVLVVVIWSNLSTVGHGIITLLLIGGAILIAVRRARRSNAGAVPSTESRAFTPPPVPPVAPASPAGWYQDPGGAPCRRWWDGASWTAHTAPEG